MNRSKLLGLVSCLAVGGVLSVYADGPTIVPQTGDKANSYSLYTGALEVDDAGVVPVPSRFRWSVETSWSGIDLNGRDLPDERILLRLYDPDHNFTALTAQIDLDVAERLQRDLAEIIAKKRMNPNYQYRPQLYDASMIPVRQVVGIDAEGVAIVEDVPTSLRPRAADR